MYLQQKLYTGGEKYEKDGVIALLLHLNGKMIEWVYKENISQCLKSKRVASREVGGERVVFSCKKVKALLQEDKQSKYGIRLLKGTWLMHKEIKIVFAYFYSF